MPLGNLPKSAKEIWEKVYKASLVESCDEECAAKKAWGAVKKAGWAKNESGEWIRNAQLESFSFRVDRASYDKTTNEMRWRCSASDIEEDLRGSNMSLELFSSFISRIDSGEPAPERFSSDYWSGGMPYVSVSHYEDMNGKAVPGTVENIYVDGSIFKSNGIFSNTPLGRACFRALNDDLYGEGKNREEHCH